MAGGPWSVLEPVIALPLSEGGPHAGRGAFPRAMILRIYCLRQWYNRSDPGAEEAAVRYPFDALVLHLELGHDPIPEETTILCFRHLL